MHRHNTETELPRSVMEPLDITDRGHFEQDPISDDFHTSAQSAEGSLLARPLHIPKSTQLSIVIDKVALKDCTVFINPFLTVSVINADGEPVKGEPSQDTPISNVKKPQQIAMNCTVHLQTPIDRMRQGCAIIFEFKHYKPKKKKISTKCWAFLELADVQPGPTALEWYCKPTDFKRKQKNLRLFTVKQLYLHLNCILLKD